MSSLSGVAVLLSEDSALSVFTGSLCSAPKTDVSGSTRRSEADPAGSSMLKLSRAIAGSSALLGAGVWSGEVLSAVLSKLGPILVTSLPEVNALDGLPGWSGVDVLGCSSGLSTDPSLFFGAPAVLALGGGADNGRRGGRPDGAFDAVAVDEAVP